MSLVRRLEQIEKRVRPCAEYGVHQFATEDRNARHTRENCPQCAAMSEAEYAAYREWCARQPADRIQVVVVVVSRRRKSADTEAAD